MNGDIVRPDWVSPDRLDDVIVGRDPSAQTDEVAEQVQLSLSQVDLPAVDPHLVAVRVNGDRARDQDSGWLPGWLNRAVRRAESQCEDGVGLIGAGHDGSGPGGERPLGAAVVTGTRPDQNPQVPAPPQDVNHSRGRKRRNLCGDDQDVGRDLAECCQGCCAVATPLGRDPAQGSNPKEISCHGPVRLGYQHRGHRRDPINQHSSGVLTPTAGADAIPGPPPRRCGLGQTPMPRQTTLRGPPRVPCIGAARSAEAAADVVLGCLICRVGEHHGRVSDLD